MSLLLQAAWQWSCVLLIRQIVISTNGSVERALTQSLKLLALLCFLDIIKYVVVGRKPDHLDPCLRNTCLRKEV